jgi:hypothetical protein
MNFLLKQTMSFEFDNQFHKIKEYLKEILKREILSIAIIPDNTLKGV